MASMARIRGSRSAGRTYQEVLKLLGFGDVDPVVLLHYLDVLHLIIEPRRTQPSCYCACTQSQVHSTSVPGEILTQTSVPPLQSLQASHFSSAPLGQI